MPAQRNLGDWVAGAGVLAVLAIVLLARWLIPEAAAIEAVAGAVGVLLVAWRVWAADEVARLLALKAAAMSFFFCLVLAWAAPLLGANNASTFFVYAWAVMMGVWLACWLVLRVRQ